MIRPIGTTFDNLKFKTLLNVSSMYGHRGTGQRLKFGLLGRLKTIGQIVLQQVCARVTEPEQLAPNRVSMIPPMKKK